MRELAKPYWIFLSVTLPQSILLFLYGSSYLVIRSLLKKEYIANWKLYGSLLVLLLCASTIYGTVLWVKRRTIDKKFAIFVFLTYLPLLYVFLMNEFEIIPFDVPRWMFDGQDLILYAFTFLMPAFAHALVLLVLWLTPKEKEHSLPRTILGAVLVPGFWYLVLNLGIPFFKSLFGSAYMSVFNKKFIGHIFLILAIGSTIAFLFFAVRLAYLMLLKKPLAEYRRAYLYKAFFLIVLPLLCFAVYNGFMSPGRAMHQVFNFLGDLSHPWYYIMAAVNGILLSLPAFQNRGLRLGLFLAKSITYSFVFYFFIAMLPFLPFSIPAIIAFGLGVLMLTPLVVMVVHTQSLTTDYQFLKEQYVPGILLSIFLAGFLVLPLGITGKFMYNRATLNRMLAYVYKPDFSVDSPASIDRSAARRTLDSIKEYKRATAAFIPERKPYITPFYRWLVLDNMTLSNGKIQVLERIFWGASDVKVQETGDVVSPGPAPTIAAIKTESSPSENGQYSRSWIHLEIKNRSARQREYLTRFRLPAGVWISDYYLKIGNERVRGILTDKKSATWVYQQITSERKDPGIVYYIENGEIALRVFPVEGGQTRYTGFEVVHRGPVRIDIDRHPITLAPAGNSEQEQAVSALDGKVVFIPKREKSKLPRFIRKPYYHFILDCSAGTGAKRDGSLARIRKLLDRRETNAGTARVTLVNYRMSTFDLSHGWEDKVRQFPAEGGFYLERAFKSILFRNYQEGSKGYPVLVVVSDNLRNAIFTGSMDGFLPLLPEKDTYYELDSSGRLNSRPLAASRIEANGKHLDRIPRHVLAWPDDKSPIAFLPDDNQATIVLKPSVLETSAADLRGISWENGLMLQGMWMNMELFPSKTEGNSLSLIKQSFRTGIMIPLTSFIALENEAQRQALLRKQERVLSANKSLDIGEESEMSEPGMAIMIIVLLLAALFIQIGKHRRGKQDH
jgi:hypothetical protein